MADTDHGSKSTRAADLTRRETVAGLGASLSLAAIASPLAASPAQADTTFPGQMMLDRTKNWLAKLNAEQNEEARFAFDSRRRATWNYMTGSSFAPGVALEKMTAEQKDLALDLLATGLSRSGLETAMNIMLQQDILRDEWGKGSPDRNRERFSLMIFGEPSETGLWGWRWEGHHLTITYTLKGTEVVAHTPKAFSSEPNTVPSGPHKGLVLLPENETLGRAIFRDLSNKNRRQALINEASLGNIKALPGREKQFSLREGVALGDLSQPQMDMIRRLIEVYTSDHLTPAFANEQQSRMKEQDLAAARFGWAGPNVADESFYYRLHGETFLIEFATLRNQPQHQHTIVHDLQRNLGAHVI